MKDLPKPGLLIALLACFLISGTIAAQDIPPNGTTTTDPDSRFNKEKAGPKKRKTLSIIKNNTKNLLYGNKCFEDFIYARGYEYVVQPKGQSRNRNEFHRVMHNFGVKVMILLRYGPFWKIKENKIERDCRNKTRDLVG